MNNFLNMTVGEIESSETNQQILKSLFYKRNPINKPIERKDPEFAEDLINSLDTKIKRSKF